MGAGSSSRCGGRCECCFVRSADIPGSVVAIFGKNLASKTEQAQETPLPTVLGGTSVTLNGVKAPLFYVSSGQINLQAPSSLPAVSGAYSPATVVVTTNSGSSAPMQVPVYATSPGIVSLDESGCGRAVALNVAPDGGLSVNSPSNSAAPGDCVIIYGTGFGAPLSPPPDGTAASGSETLMIAPGVVIDGSLLPSYEYGGLAPGLAGVDEMKFQIPATHSRAGAVELKANQTGISVTSQPVPQTGGVAYQQSLPAGFITAGAYTISGSGGSVKFEGAMTVPPPIQIETPFSPGTTIVESVPLTISWTGGTPGMLVKATVASIYGFTSHFDYGYADAGSNSFTFTPFCSGGSGGTFCTLGLPSSSQAQITIELSPGKPVSVQAQGVADGVQLLWKYQFVFGGLVLE